MKNNIIKLGMATFVVLFSIYCSGSGNVDLSKAKKLTPEKVDFIDPDNTPSDQNVQQVSLFSLKPGESISYKALGAIDPVGTSLINDYDGDGITNENETVTNIWIADYPRISISIAPPVTMKVRVEKEDKTQTSEITNEISSQDFEDNKTKGSESYHQNQVNVETKKVGETRKKRADSGSTSSETTGTSTNTSTASGTVAAEASGKFFTIAAKVSASGTKSSSSTNTNTSKNNFNKAFADEFGSTKDVYEDVKGKNNIDKDAKSQKSDSSAKNARKYRSELRTKKSQSFLIKPNAGYVRAALYIKNNSVNLPVKISNVLCSLMFETPEGTYIPVQSFRLRNDDFSLFSVNVYGDEEFGPYVVELDNLNTVEIENAILKGYNPKIFIVDYEMTHIPDSNYKSVLLNFSGDNLKVIEENSKGRTAAIRLFGPGLRDFYRMSAFDIQGLTDQCSLAAATNFVAGVSLRKILERLGCNSINVQFKNYLFNFGEYFPELEQKLVVIPTIETLGSIDTKIPCTEETITSGASSLVVCRVAAYDTWTDSQKANFGLWTVMSDGKHYDHSNYLTDLNGDPIYYNGAEKIVVLKGIDGTIWAGDHVDLVYLSQPDQAALLGAYGKNPLETGEGVNFNTRWSKALVGDKPYYPNVFSTLLGKASPGEEIEVNIKLNSTYHLDPSFGDADTAETGKTKYNNFSYNFDKADRLDTINKFKVLEAFNFEISFGLGGDKENWYNVTERKVSGTDLQPCDGQTSIVDSITWNFLAQEFTVCFKVPDGLDGVNSGDLVDIYLRPTLNNASRESIWPMPFDKVNKYVTSLRESISLTSGGQATIKVNDGIGNIADVQIGDKFTSNSITGLELTVDALPVIATTPEVGFDITVTSNQTVALDVNIAVSVDAPLTESQVSVNIDNGFFADWNANLPAGNGLLLDSAFDTANCGDVSTYSGIVSPNCFGYDSDFLYGNYVGVGSFVNDWTDANKLVSSVSDLSGGSFTSVLAQTSNYDWMLSSANGILQLQPTTGDQGFFANDFLISTNSSGNQTDPQVFIENGKALVVWSTDIGNDNNIRGQVIDLVTGSKIGGEILVSTGNTFGIGQRLPQVFIENDKAFVIWRSIDVRGQMIDMVTGSKLGGEILVSTGNLTQPDIPQVFVENGKALVIWQSFDNGVDFDIHSQVIDMASGSKLGSELLVSTNNAFHQVEPQVFIENGRALVVWQSFNIGVDSDIHGQVIDMVSGSKLGSELLVSTTNTGRQTIPQVFGENGKALVVWLSSDSGNDYDIRGQVIDTATGSKVGSEIFVSIDKIDTQATPGVVIENGKALVVWHSSTVNSGLNIIGQVIDVTTGSKLGSLLLVSTNNANGQLRPQVFVENGKAMVVWMSSDSGVDFDIRGQLVDMVSSSKLGGELSISSSNTDNQTDPQLFIENGKVFIVWLSYTGFDSDIRGRIYLFEKNVLVPTAIDYGVNNFFLAPLIERDYTVTTRIKY